MHLYHIILAVEVSIAMMVGPSRGTDKIGPLAELVDLPQSCNFHGVGIADA
jgi:hypothetical protein